MLRGLSARKLQELLDFERMESPERRMDLRFAILASLVAVAGNVNAADGKPYSQGHFLDQLEKYTEVYDAWATGEKLPAPPPPKQSTEIMVQHLDSWISGSNRALQERRGGGLQ
jgi:hypothetical protein